MSRVLILEDDEYIRSGLCKLLEQQGFDVNGVGTVEAFFQSVNAAPAYDMYLVDVMLPDGNGFDVCKRLRENSEAVIIFLTSCDDEESIIKGLDIGADDYITKPFRTAELLSRIQANLRRFKHKVSQVEINQDEICVDREGFTVTKNGENISLSPMEFDLLNILVANSGLIVRREMLLEKLWDNSGNFVEDGTLTVTVSRLKSKLGNDKSGKPYIETIRGVGYRWK